MGQACDVTSRKVPAFQMEIQAVSPLAMLPAADAGYMHLLLSRTFATANGRWRHCRGGVRGDHNHTLQTAKGASAASAPLEHTMTVLSGCSHSLLACLPLPHTEALLPRYPAAPLRDC